MLFDSFTGSRLADLETPEGGTRSASHRAAELPTPARTVAVADGRPWSLTVSGIIATLVAMIGLTIPSGHRDLALAHRDDDMGRRRDLRSRVRVAPARSIELSMTDAAND
jgi:hypothetical protein